MLSTSCCFNLSQFLQELLIWPKLIDLLENYRQEVESEEYNKFAPAREKSEKETDEVEWGEEKPSPSTPITKLLCFTALSIIG